MGGRGNRPGGRRWRGWPVALAAAVAVTVAGCSSGGEDHAAGPGAAPAPAPSGPPAGSRAHPSPEHHTPAASRRMMPA
ncbi:hypothetical protein [Nocardia wallacei]|uniref:hypothetical protein n=1 Tax=Nocardia wallacei TaxID=480035 RepID=UPI0024543C60|nr:hypothetical protein [Nocardia wallacei]